jgi:hypothetical protein
MLSVMSAFGVVVRGSAPAATGTARTERRAASARFQPSAGARLLVRDAPDADEEQASRVTPPWLRKSREAEFSPRGHG